MDHRIFRIPLLSFFFRTARAIPIAPAREDPEVLERAYDAIAEALENGELVGLFPEGRLTTDGEIAQFRSGVNRIVARTPVPVDSDGALGSLGQPLRKAPRQVEARAVEALSTRAGRGRRCGRAVGGRAGPSMVVLELRGDWR